MGHRCFSKKNIKRGLWSVEEDEKLINYITTHGHGSWSSVPKLAGLQRCGKSCRQRWVKYLRPDLLKRGSFTAKEEQTIIEVHKIIGNKWAQIAKHLPGRADNGVKNFWISCIKKKLISQGLVSKTHNLISSHQKASNMVPCSATQPILVPMEMNPPVLTLPTPPLLNSTQLPLIDSMAIPIFEYQNPNIVLSTVKDQNNNDIVNFPCASSIESTPISSSNEPLVS